MQTTTTTSWGGTSASAAASFSYANSMSATNPDPTNIVCTPTSSGNAGTINTTYVMNTYRSKLIAVPIILTFDFPANTIYNILWDWSFTGVIAGQEHAMLYFTEDSSTLDNFLVGKYEGTWSNHSNPYTFNDTVVYNNTNTDKNNYTLYGMYYAYCNNKSSGSVSFTFDFSLRFLEGPQIDAPQTSGDIESTYTGNPIEFGFKYAGEPTVETVKDFRGITESYVYDKAYECVELDSVTGTTFGGDPITIANSTVVLNGTNNGEGTFSPTEAGEYKVKLKVKNSFVASGVRFSDGSSEKTLTFTIKRKTVAVPTVLNSTQTYKAGEYEFGLSGYDKDIMSVDQAALATGITWDNTAGSEKFKATDAATYTVKFHLDSTNYV
ncbi:MAG: hypothetical protein K2J83_03805, partial [Clostridia bacterium]|nr:hypothetical protein [Clostridia bacterium]